jgi:hypothetical protein
MDTLSTLNTLYWQMANEDSAYGGDSYNHLARSSLERLLDCANPTSVDSWHAVEKVLHRAWWSRAWIVQEATIAQESTWIFCGSKNVCIRVLWGLRDIYFALAAQGPIQGFEFLAEISRSLTYF